MKELEFYKYSGHGNDFVILDNWDGQVAESEMPKMARLVCRPKFGVGADGMVFVIAGPDEVDFAWRFFNADGSEADMCGNAGRCTAHLANQLGIAPASMTFSTKAGLVEAEVGDHSVSIQMPKVGRPEGSAMVEVDGFNGTYHRLNVGVPHAVALVDDLERLPVVKVGREVRHHPSFAPEGANVNFAKALGKNRLALRTYERGVEDETQACGTGAVAAVLVAAAQQLVEGPAVRVLTRGGEDLLVTFQGPPEAPEKVFLAGPVRHTFTGQIKPDLYKP